MSRSQRQRSVVVGLGLLTTLAALFGLLVGGSYRVSAQVAPKPGFIGAPVKEPGSESGISGIDLAEDREAKETLRETEKYIQENKEAPAPTGTSRSRRSSDS